MILVSKEESYSDDFVKIIFGGKKQRNYFTAYSKPL